MPYSLSNLGKSFTSTYNGGGPVYIGNTRYGWDGIGNVLEQDFFSALIVSNCNQVGFAEGNSKLNSNFSNQFTALSHNLLGDPEMPMWTASPKTFSPTISLNGTTITVNPGSNVNQACTICVMSASDGGNTYFSVLPPAIGTQTFTNVPTGIPYFVTITSPNYIPYFTSQGWPSTVYLQDQTISTPMYINCQSLSAGNDVTNTLQEGNVNINSGAVVSIIATENITLAPGFIVNLGATFYFGGKNSKIIPYSK